MYVSYMSERSQNSSMALDRILNHNAGPIIYFAHKDGMEIEELASFYKTTPRIIRLMLRRYRRKVMRMSPGLPKEPA